MRQRRGHTLHNLTISAESHLRPQRWNWSAVVRPLDRRLAAQAPDALTPQRVFSLRYFWIDGLFATISESFFLTFIPLFALAYGATNAEVGWLTAVGNLLGAAAFFPGARLAERGRRKPIVLWSVGGLGRLALLFLAIVPLVAGRPLVAIALIILFNGLRAFFSNLSNPAWTALVADLVPEAIRGRYFGSRNMVMGVATLLVTPLAGRLIVQANGLFDMPYLGYQAVFFLSFVTGMVATASFRRIEEPQTEASAPHPHQPGDLRRALRESPGFGGLVLSAFVWNLALQVAAPFFNVYLVTEFAASTTVIGLLASVSSLFALMGQQVFGRLLDQRGAIWVQSVCGLIVPLLPLGWLFITAPWQVGLINAVGGVAWAGYNLSNFNLLLHLTPDAARPRAVALYQTAVFASAVIGPLLGGFLADAVSFKLLFGLSGAGRFTAMLLFFWLTARKVRKQLQPIP